MNAIALNARPSASFDAKLAQTKALLQQAAQEFAPALTLACSLGAEDMVLADLVTALTSLIPAHAQTIKNAAA